MPVWTAHDSSLLERLGEQLFVQALTEYRDGNL